MYKNLINQVTAAAHKLNAIKASCFRVNGCLPELIYYKTRIFRRRGLISNVISCS
jgi:hypothetical protein